jgi:hypothetical protein
LEIWETQRLLCNRFGCSPVYVAADDVLGAARSLFATGWPLKGIRHLPTNGTSGWYIWSGDYSNDPGFFESQHAAHVFAARPEVSKYLGLPPGWGFIIAPGYEDVWQDDKLLVE